MKQLGSRTDRGKHSPAAAPIRVLLCDDHTLVRACVREMLKGVLFIDVVGEAANGLAGTDLALELKPDVILMDVSMPQLDGIEATRRILAQLPRTRVLAFSADAEAVTMRKMIAAGARGFLAKTASPEQLVCAIQRVAAGGHVFGASPDHPATRPRPD